MKGWSTHDKGARLGADIYREQAMIEEFLHGSGDMHSLVAKKCFPEELKNIDVKNIKKLRPDLRSKAKGPEFALQFGGSPYSIQSSLGCSLEEAEDIADAYWGGFPGVAKFKEQASKAVRKTGRVILCPITGHKTYWWDHKYWLKVQESFTPAFWEDYRLNHKGKITKVQQLVSTHFKAASLWDRKGLNSPTQGEGCVILKHSMIKVFDWIIENNYFGKILICALVHDECNIEFPKELKDTFPQIVQDIMKDTAAIYCKSLPIPADADVDFCWRH